MAEIDCEGYECAIGLLRECATEFHLADLARRERTDQARSLLRAWHRGNALAMDGEPWSFPEYRHGRNPTPGGTRRQGWSAAAALLGHHALQRRNLFGIDDDQL